MNLRPLKALRAALVALPMIVLSIPGLAEDNFVVVFPVNPGVQLTGESTDDLLVPDEADPDNPDFYRVGATIFCPDAAVGDTGMIGGVEYTKRSSAEITVGNAATTCTSGITSMHRLFDGAWFHEPIGHWDTSSVTSMRSMFEDVRLSVSVLGIDNWDVSNVTDMSLMFLRSHVNDPIGGWDVSSVTNMQWMFRSARFNHPIGDWDVSSVTNMQNMFHHSSFNHPISAWDVSNVSHMNEMFHYASSFNQDLSGWCVSQIGGKPYNFDLNARSWSLPRPAWGACP